MEKIETGIPGLLILKPRVFEDSRGYFYESFNKKEMDFLNLSYDWVQDNQSNSIKGVIRGLHFQREPFAQAKLIRVLQGNIWDVTVDIRKGSPTFGKVYATELSSENRLQLLIPQGFAHGFSVLSETASVTYKCDNYYHYSHEAGILLDDPELNIDWKVPMNNAIISQKDRDLPPFSSLGTPFIFKHA